VGCASVSVATMNNPSLAEMRNVTKRENNTVTSITRAELSGRRKLSARGTGKAYN
jgi:hypothetical protein